MTNQIWLSHALILTSQISHICQAFLRFLISASHILLKTICLKCYSFFAPHDGPITSKNRPHTCIQRDDESRVKKKHIYNTYDFLRLQNKTRTLRKITHTTAHPTAMPITALFVPVSLVPLLVADSVSEVVC